jgi:hypothetical protein
LQKYDRAYFEEGEQRKIEGRKIMKRCKRVGCGNYTFALCTAGILLLLVSGLPLHLSAKEQLSVTRDSEKTVYSIESSDRTKREDAEERDRAWDMLNHMPIILDNRQNVPVRPAPPR